MTPLDRDGLTPDEQRAKLAVEDPLLPQATFATRGLYGIIGVQLGLWPERDHDRQLLVRLTEAQSQGLALDLLFMLELSCESNQDPAREKAYRQIRRDLKDLLTYYEITVR